MNKKIYLMRPFVGEEEPGVKIGEGSIVGAGSVVKKDISPYSVVAGNPAKILRKREGREIGKYAFAPENIA